MLIVSNKSQLIQNTGGGRIDQNFQKYNCRCWGVAQCVASEQGPGFHSQLQAKQNRIAKKDMSRMHNKIIFEK